MPPLDTVEISKNAIRERAARFIQNHASDVSEASEKQTFWNDFFDVFGISRRRVGTFELLAERVTTGSHGWIDFLFPGQMGVEHKSAGENLDAAMDQLVDYLPSLHSSEHPWLLVVCDFQRFQWKNLESGGSGSVPLSELIANLDLFWWIAGYSRPGERTPTEEDANLKATRLLARIHDELSATGYPTHALRQWITRILFCLFADDTDIWDRSLFHTYIARSTRIDGTDLGRCIAEIFQILDSPIPERPSSLDEDLQDLTYINGDLFSEILPIPALNESTRNSLLEACRFNWAEISPAIFGSLFQNVMTPAERRDLGAHYTSEENILRTIRPLFLDGLQQELESSRTLPKLDSFHNKISSLKFFDPACGCGNFLVVTYRELRKLETECLRRIAVKERTEGQRIWDLDLLVKVSVGQFYGIEVEEFPALIARTALYLADHLANREISTEFGEHFLRFPIPAAPNVVIGNALTVDWNSVVPNSDVDFVFGNPPFAGHTTRSRAQSDELRNIWGSGYAKWLDYVTGWYKISIEYGAGQNIRFAFVSTSSISQGEQVARLWEPLLAAGYTIDFAYQTLAWQSEAQGTANVHVVIVGFSNLTKGPPTLFVVDTPSSEPIPKNVKNISP